MGEISVHRVTDSQGPRLEVHDRYGTLVGSLSLRDGTLAPRRQHEAPLLVALLAEWFDVDAGRFSASALTPQQRTNAVQVHPGTAPVNPS